MRSIPPRQQVFYSAKSGTEKRDRTPRPIFLSRDVSVEICSGRSALRRLAHEAGADPLLHVGLQHAERLLVTLDRHGQGLQHPLRREEVRDDPLRDGDRLRGHAKGGCGFRPKSMINSSGVPVTRQKLAYSAKAFESSISN